MGNAFFIGTVFIALYKSLLFVDTRRTQATTQASQTKRTPAGKRHVFSYRASPPGCCYFLLFWWAVWPMMCSGTAAQPRPNSCFSRCQKLGFSVCWAVVSVSLVSAAGASGSSTFITNLMLASTPSGVPV